MKLSIPTAHHFRKYLLDNGFELHPGRGKGDHEVWVHPEDHTRRVVLDAGRKTPKIGTFKQMLRTGRLNEADFRQA
ncbi:hypothetical protein GCM10017784_37110 [Deinococcus indicus]|nr:hypothetical protein GCM10017784_37110 [Deinococcus indicus]